MRSEHIVNSDVFIRTVYTGLLLVFDCLLIQMVWFMNT